MWEWIEFRTINRCRMMAQSADGWIVSKFTNSFIEIRCVFLFLQSIFFVRKLNAKIYCTLLKQSLPRPRRNIKTITCGIILNSSLQSISFETRSKYHLFNERVPCKFCSGFSLLFLRFHRKLDLTMRYSKSNCKSQPFIYVCKFIHFTSNYFRSRSHREHLWSYWSRRCATQNVTIHDQMKLT